MDHRKGDQGPQAYNVDLDGDGENDFYVEPMVRTGFTVDGAITVYARPDLFGDELGTLDDGDVDIIGRTEDWYCIEFGPTKQPGFSQDVGLY